MQTLQKCHHSKEELFTHYNMPLLPSIPPCMPLHRNQIHHKVHQTQRGEQPVQVVQPPLVQIIGELGVEREYKILMVEFFNSLKMRV